MHHRLAAMMLAASESSTPGGGSGTAPYEDNFDTGSTIDTAGTRYTGANPWTLYNDAGATVSVAAGQLSMTCPFRGLMSPVLAVQTLGAGDGAWRCDFSIGQPGANYRGSGIVLRESATGKMLLHGFGSDGPIMARVRRVPNPNNTTFTNWTANYGGTSVTDLAGWCEVERVGAAWTFRYSEDGSSWTTLVGASGIVQTVDFTVAPDQIGLWVTAAVAGSLASTAVYSRFWKV
jgi:hypothetical protein